MEGLDSNNHLLTHFTGFVARGFVTGSTDTSLWTVYNKGSRNYCGNVLPDGGISYLSFILKICLFLDLIGH